MSPVDDLAFFQRLALAGSLTATARDLGLSVSAVSKRLKQLELRLGVSLASRTTRRLTLTAEGERYLTGGGAILDELAELEEGLSAHRTSLSGSLKVNATFGLGRHHVAPLLSRFCTSHPNVEGILELTNFPIAPGEQGVDISIRVGALPDSRLLAKRILENRRILCAAPRYVEQMPPLSVPSDLSKHSCLVLRENDSDFAVWRFEHRLGQHKAQAIKVSGPLVSNDGEVIVNFALDAHGIILRSYWDVQTHLDAGRLVPLLPHWQGIRADFHAVYLQRRNVPARLRAFIELLQQEIPLRVASQYSVESPMPRN